MEKGKKKSDQQSLKAESPKGPDSDTGNVDQNEETVESVKQWNFAVHLFKRITQKEFNPVEEGITGIKDEYVLYRKRKKETLDKYLAYDTVIDNATDTIEYYILLILSCIIATLGLLENSAAVIIGAMIVAPLMGPILGFSAGVMWGKGKDVFEAATTMIKGVILVLLITSLTAFLFPYVDLNEQIMSRTHPGLLDTVIALASGLIGSYAYVNNRVSSSIPGVAISVALMPPLCTAGIGIGIARWDVATGGILLFLVNLIGISLAAVVVFYLVRLTPHAYSDEENGQFKRRFTSHFIASLILLLILSAPLAIFTAGAYTQSADRNLIQGAVYSVINTNDIYDMKIVPKDDGYRVIVVVFDRRDVEDVKEALKKLGSVISEVQVYSLNRADFND